MILTIRNLDRIIGAGTLYSPSVIHINETKTEYGISLEWDGDQWGVDIDRIAGDWGWNLVIRCTSKIVNGEMPVWYQLLTRSDVATPDRLMESIEHGMSNIKTHKWNDTNN